MRSVRTIPPSIRSGGSGTLLWPLSRELYLKRMLSLTSEQTLFQQTVGSTLSANTASA